jgi:pimeloyl-ACP methyl ester carboxylesterase
VGVIKRVAGGIAGGLLFCSIGYAGCVGFLWANETRIVFRSHISRAAASAWVPDGVEHIAIPTADGLRLETLRLDAADPAAPWIVFFHGSGHSIRNPRVEGQLQQLRALGYNVLAPEYRGFGRNEGTPSERGLYEDARAAHRYLTGELRVAASRIVLAGRSLGSAVAVETASRLPTAGVVLFSPIDSIPLMGTRMYPWVPVSLLASSRFDSLSKIGSVRAPVVVIHSGADRWVPMAAARELFARARGPKLMVETTGGHNRAGFDDVEELRATLGAFWPTTSVDDSESPAWHGARATQ